MSLSYSDHQRIIQEVLDFVLCNPGCTAQDVAHTVFHISGQAWADIHPARWHLTKLVMDERIETRDSLTTLRYWVTK